MSLHARKIAIMVGATGFLIDILVERRVSERKIRLDRAKELLEEYIKVN